MKAPKYNDQYVATDAVECSICGCIVTDRVRHDSFHEALVRMLGIVDGTLDALRGN